jgi:hypothetical protein
MLKSVVFISLFVSFALGQVSAPVKLNTLQTQISQCGLSFPDLAQIKNYDQLYNAVAKKYFLLSEKIVDREILFRSKNENFKLKVNNDVISIFKIGDEDRVTPVPFDAKQKIRTIKGKIKQLTLNTRIEEDWGQYFEQREMGIQVEYSTRKFKISQLKITQTKTNQVLDCKLKNQSEVCYCLK